MRQSRPKRLSASFVRTVKRPGRYGDGYGGHGLSLLVKPRAHGGMAKSWSQRLRINGKPCNIGLGPFPIVTLAEARDAALENARAVYQGRDPRERTAIPTFDKAAETVIEMRASTWRNPLTANIWRSSFKRLVSPKIGMKPINAITSADILSVLTPIWNNGRHETARRLRHRIGAVMRWSIGAGHRVDNPAGDAISQALPKNGTAPQRHRRALHHREVAGALARIRASDAGTATKLLLEFIILTTVRSGEARLANWSEVDLPAAVWTVPAERMKSGREHRVPLSTRALEVLAEAQQLTDGSGLLFPSPTGKAMGAMTTSKLLNRARIDASTHGFRTSFRSWCAENNESRELAEIALAHVVAGVEGAYMRSDLFERRRKLMQAWADYLSVPAAG
ncbi:MAG: tyrosine-type recombinase/integrase [Spirochaetaceae bacterium]|nr:tyrosine-type recombinase/integrase [Spirochaetaceae bacterium]